MKAIALLNSKPVVIGAGVAVAAVAVYFIGKKLGGALKSGAKAAVDYVDSINEGTPYAGAGAVGTLGNAANQVSGGVLADFGGWIGRGLYGLFADDYDPNK